MKRQGFLAILRANLAGIEEKELEDIMKFHQGQCDFRAE